MTIEQAIKMAVEAGWSDRLYRTDFGHPDNWTHSVAFLLDPAFWQSLGKALGWTTTGVATAAYQLYPEWLDRWHRFIDHLADGGTPESYFKDLT